MAPPSTPLAVTLPNRAYIPALDGLRAVAILVVVAAHAGLEHVVPGAFGVTLFFFISGYLITRQMLHSLALRGRIGLADFYLRRILRLAPAGLVYVVISGGVYIACGGHITVPAWLCAIFYGANIYDLWVGYRSTLAGVRHPFNILWSLAIEEHFYAFWPLLLGAIWRWSLAIVMLLVLCTAVLIWRVWLFNHCSWDFSVVCGRIQPNPAWRYNRLYQGTDTRLDSLAWGVVLAIIEDRRRAWTPRLIAVAWPAGLCLLLVSFVLQAADSRFTFRPSLQGAALLLIFPALLNGENAARHVLSAPAARLIGRLSYSLYLWHWGAFALADGLAGTSRPLWLAIGLPAAALLSAASYLFVEQPMLRFRRRAGSEVAGS